MELVGSDVSNEEAALSMANLAGDQITIPLIRERFLSDPHG
jgi:hypothetical protein